MKHILEKIIQRNSGKEEIKIVDIESVFNKTYDIDKFIDEYREFIVWVNDKYPSFREEIKNDCWIQRIIKEHEEILVNLRNTIKGEIKEPEYVLYNKEKTNKILSSDIKNMTCINQKVKDPFMYNVGLIYLKKFIIKYPNQSNFLDKDIINEIISTDREPTVNLNIYKEPFMYIYEGISRIVVEFKTHKNIIEDNELNIKEVINFAEELVNKVQMELGEKEKEYNNYLKSLEEKAKNAIHITEKIDGLIFLGQYVEKYPEIHRVEVYEDNDKKIYRLDLKF